MDLKRLTRMFLCDFHKKHFLRVWKVGNLTSIDQIHLVNYLWFYNTTDEEGTGKFWREKQYSLCNCLLRSKTFDADGYLNNISDPLPGLIIKRQCSEADIHIYDTLYLTMTYITYNSTGKDNEKKWKDLRGPKKH